MGFDIVTYVISVKIDTRKLPVCATIVPGPF